MYEVKLGEPLGKITGETVLDLTANKTSDECFYFENPGEYQFYFENRISNIKGKFETLEILAVGKESEKLKVFILP